MTQTFETVVVLDFEATCQRGAPPAPQEVIEFPSVLVSLREQAVVDSFSSFVRPVHHPQLSEFCRQLTSIRQQDVDGPEGQAQQAPRQRSNPTGAGPSAVDRALPISPRTSTCAAVRSPVLA